MTFTFKEQREKKAFLALADGNVFHGYSVGAPADIQGEAVFNTSMIGYQEILSNPLYKGKLIVMTAPEIGSYGTNQEGMVSDKFFASGLIMRSINEASNWSSEESLESALVRHNTPAIAGIDTRALTHILRESGPQKAFICASASLEPSEAIKRLC
ncbi:MAG: hypothetical protein LBH25_10960 [Fibromonadaceae bacterium]|jgi:carbamoyl-phosphate synthase small subunit|nr:hypothetical protein [Fibromonadaceae bacterium]